VRTLPTGGGGERYVSAHAIAGPIVELALRTLDLRDLSLLGATCQPVRPNGREPRSPERPRKRRGVTPNRSVQAGPGSAPGGGAYTSSDFGEAQPGAPHVPGVASAPARRGRRGQPRPQPSSRDRGCTGGWLRGRSPEGATAATLDACASRSATVRRPRPKPATTRAGRRPAWRRGTRSPQPPENPVRLETCREPDLAPVKAASGWWLRAPSPEPGRMAIGRGPRGQRSRTAPQAAR